MATSEIPDEPAPKSRFSHPALQFMTIHDHPCYQTHNDLVRNTRMILTDEMLAAIEQFKEFEEKIKKDPKAKETIRQIKDIKIKLKRLGFPLEYLMKPELTVSITAIPQSIPIESFYETLTDIYNVTIVHMSDALTIDANNSSFQECKSLTVANKEQRDYLIALSLSNELKIRHKDIDHVLLCTPFDQTTQTHQSNDIFLVCNSSRQSLNSSPYQTNSANGAAAAMNSALNSMVPSAHNILQSVDKDPPKENFEEQLQKATAREEAMKDEPKEIQEKPKEIKKLHPLIHLYGVEGLVQWI